MCVLYAGLAWLTDSQFRETAHRGLEFAPSAGGSRLPLRLACPRNVAAFALAVAQGRQVRCQTIDRTLRNGSG